MFFFFEEKCVIYYFFFFQAEDGIRDADVTGVQTCALPIWARAESGGPGKEIVKTPMQGTIVKVLVADGDPVKPKQTLVVLEAMKMENHVIAHQAGTVSSITVSEGQTVSTGAVIATIEAT